MGDDTWNNAVNKKWYTTINDRQYMLRIPNQFVVKDTYHDIIDSIYVIAKLSFDYWTCVQSNDHYYNFYYRTMDEKINKIFTGDTKFGVVPYLIYPLN